MLNKYPSRKILVIDDDDATCILINEVIADTCIDIIAAGYGKEALCIFKKYTLAIALVLLDIKLPDVSGWELIKLFRFENPIVPIIVISAISPAELKEKAIVYSLNSYISKPFNIEELKRIVEFYLNRQPVTI